MPIAKKCIYAEGLSLPADIHFFASLGSNIFINWRTDWYKTPRIYQIRHDKLIFGGDF